MAIAPVPDYEEEDPHLSRAWLGLLAFAVGFWILIGWLVWTWWNG